MLLLATLAGCGRPGPQLAPVSGRVTLDGQPLDAAEVLFQPDEGTGSPSYGFTDQNGQYELGYKRGVKGAMVGSHTVSIEMDTRITGPDGNLKRRRQLLPPRYNTQSELRREVKPDRENVIDFDLTSDPNEAVSRERGARS
jgi:predicted small lipoprotein YifL